MMNGIHALTGMTSATLTTPATPAPRRRAVRKRRAILGIALGALCLTLLTGCPGGDGSVAATHLQEHTFQVDCRDNKAGSFQWAFTASTFEMTGPLPDEMAKAVGGANADGAAIKNVKGQWRLADKYTLVLTQVAVDGGQPAANEVVLRVQRGGGPIIQIRDVGPGFRMWKSRERATECPVAPAAMLKEITRKP